MSMLASHASKTTPNMLMNVKKSERRFLGIFLLMLRMLMNVNDDLKGPKGSGIVVP